MDDPNDKMIDRLLADVARADAPSPSDALMARIMADAAGAPNPVAAVDPIPAKGLRGVWEAIGGWPAMGGLVAAGVAGLWIGVSPGAGAGDLMAGVFGDDVTVDLLAGADALGWEVEG